jgi:hypothetical protein
MPTLANSSQDATPDPDDAPPPKPRTSLESYAIRRWVCVHLRRAERQAARRRRQQRLHVAPPVAQEDAS